jgi:hypothetical protein
MPELEAEAVQPGGEVVDLGPLSPDQRVQLEAEVDAGVTPGDAPAAGLGGASSGSGTSAEWLAAGGAFLVLAGLANFALWRRRRGN